MLENVPHQINRHHVQICGTVQGVGFRPFVYRLATELNLTGWVNNSPQGVIIEIEGKPELLTLFRHRLTTEIPPHASLDSIQITEIPPLGEPRFEIHQSETTGHRKTAIVLPDLATCPACLQDIFDPQNRRHRYPFTNCTHCGPRYSIIKTLPYDRAQTTMARFVLCAACRAEYENPLDRRFHAQPNACPDCGPQLEFWDQGGTVLAQGNPGLLMAVAAIQKGKIIAVKGLGGFHLMVDARNETAVDELRHRKQRPHKPFAVLYPNLEQVSQDCNLSEAEASLLQSDSAPIVLLRLRDNLSNSLASGVSPNNPYLGVMLPYTPLHHLLMAELGVPVVATSGNLADEPICIDEHEALERLGAIADGFLVHNRPIFRPVDDSVVRVIDDQPMILRRARGYAPAPVKIPSTSKSQNILAVGAHLKNTVAIAIEEQVFLSQHLGDLETPESYQAFQQAITSLSQIYDFTPDVIVCDAHPDYRSSQFAHQLADQIEGCSIVSVQHHYAHILAGMAEHHLKPPILGIAWDGTGYGLDQTIWGGEFFHVSASSWQRVAHFQPFKLPGGEKAIQEPRRIALGLLYEVFGVPGLELNLKPVQSFRKLELQVIKMMLTQDVNSPKTSSVGRLFDGVAALLGLAQRVSFEGQAAMALEFAIGEVITDQKYGFKLESCDQREEVGELTPPSPPLVRGGRRNGIKIDWRLVIWELLADLEAGVPVSVMAAKFHNTLVEIMVTVAEWVGESQVILAGGCFQNRYLLERAILRLRQAQFCPYWCQQVPGNDGGIALGQIMAGKGF